MKPDKPGEWHSRTRKIVVFPRAEGPLSYRDMFDVYSGGDVADLPDDDWRPATPPEFPELPPRPPRYGACLTVTEQHRDQPAWRIVAPYGKFVNVSGVLSLMEVVPHPENDPEAVRLIAEAQK